MVSCLVNGLRNSPLCQQPKQSLRVCFRELGTTWCTESQLFSFTASGRHFPASSMSTAIALPEGTYCSFSNSTSGDAKDDRVMCVSQSAQSATEDQDPCSSPSVESVPSIEKKFVHNVYDAIAPHFSSTRFSKWPKVAEFLNHLPPGSVVIDAGCGNGKYLGFNPDCYFIGCDISNPLIKICAEKGHEVMVADAVNLPYRNGFGDAAISIALLHHLSTESRRRKAVEELVRVVRKGGLILITVWAVEQMDKSLLSKWTPLSYKYDEGWVETSGSPQASSALKLGSIPENSENKEKESDDSQMYEMAYDSPKPELLESHQEYFVPWHLPYHRAEVSGASVSAVASGLARNDDKKGAVVYNRYYHVFAEGELERLVSGLNNVVIRDHFYDKSNWCIILEVV